jgi:hypothetical protein
MYARVMTQSVFCDMTDNCLWSIFSIFKDMDCYTLCAEQPFQGQMVWPAFLSFNHIIMTAYSFSAEVGIMLIRANTLSLLLLVIEHRLHSTSNEH